MRKVASLGLVLVVVAGACGGGGESASTTAAEPLPLTQTHEWSYADVLLPAAWSVTRELPGGFQVASEPGLTPGFGLESGQVQLTIGYLLNTSSIDRPLVDVVGETFDRWDLTLADSTTTTMLGHPAEIVTATGEDFDQFDARIVTGPATAFFLSAYAPPGELGLYRATFEEIVATATLKGILADD